MQLWSEILKKTALTQTELKPLPTKDVLICLPPWPSLAILLKSTPNAFKTACSWTVLREHSRCRTKEKREVVLEANFSRWIRCGLQQAWGQEGSKAHCQQTECSRMDCAQGFTGSLTIWKSLSQAQLCCCLIKKQPLPLYFFFFFNCALKLEREISFVTDTPTEYPVLYCLYFHLIFAAVLA